MLVCLFPTGFVGFLGHRLQLDTGIREHDGVASDIQVQRSLAAHIVGIANRLLL